jgi:UDP-N-acetylmuramoyl-L-alanyl-D-glutamate--2,6-diaminopimelate ligase
MTLKEILRAAHLHPVELLGDAEVSSVTSDSRSCKPGSLFVCMPGGGLESESFLPNAAANGATAGLVHSREGMEIARQLGLAAVLSPHVGVGFQDTAWRLCDAFYEHPTRQMKMVGVTGTNGKTTTAWLLRDMLRASGKRAGYIGTLGFQIPGRERELQNTTPVAVELYALMAEARDGGVNAMAMEASSHALAQHRADGVEFDAAVFTNLTQDHLDFHESMDAYGRAKWRLFDELPRCSEKRFRAAFNMDDPTGRAWAARPDGADPNPLRFGTRETGEDLDLLLLATDVRVDTIEALIDGIPVKLPLGGAYNVQNAAAAAAGMLALGYSVREIAELLPAVHAVPGRFEAVPNDRGLGILIDYAHTSDALTKLLTSVRGLTTGRIVTVFGCGGDRDRSKRPLMAKAASEHSDLTIVTSDNPRTEDPNAIIRDVMRGIEPGKQSLAIEDRREAVARAIKWANPNDVIVIAGKGHETYQIIAHTKHPMDDRDLVREALS